MNKGFQILNSEICNISANTTIKKPNIRFIKKGKKNMNAQTAIMNEDEWNDYLLFQMKKEHMADDEEWATRVAEQGLAILKNEGPKNAIHFFTSSAYVFAKMIELDTENLIPEEVKCKYALFHYDTEGDLFSQICETVRQAGKYRPADWDKKMPAVLRGRKAYYVYRGGSESIDEANNKISWSLSRDVAEFFIYRKSFFDREPQHLYRGIIDADKIISYNNDRTEFEVLQDNSVRGIEELPIEGQNEEFKRLKKTGSVRSKQKIERLVCDRAEFVEDDA